MLGVSPEDWVSVALCQRYPLWAISNNVNVAALQIAHLQVCTDLEAKKKKQRLRRWENIMGASACKP